MSNDDLHDKKIGVWYTGAMGIEAELLAPAGNMTALHAAVDNGADAVYLALDKFGARAKAENFTLETLSEAVQYAHLFGVKIYLAVNTLIAENEIAAALDMVTRAKGCGIDAFIVQDIGLAREILSIMPDIVLHASTQMGIHNAEGAIFARDLGIRRVVLSRETRLSDIRKIKQETGLEIEYFIHGALCVGFSGNCYLSSLVSGLSGNRGRCLQLCRKKYRVACDGAERHGYYLSPKDLCMLDRLQQLHDAGVDSFKIEGRMRSVEYVAETTRVYRKILDGAVLGLQDQVDLKAVFNRGDYCYGYLDGKNVIYPDMQSHKGQYVGKVGAIVDRKAHILQTTDLEPGDGVKFVRNKREVGAASLSGNPTTFAGKVTVGDLVYRTSSKRLSVDVASRKKKLPVSAEAFIQCGLPIRLQLTCGDASIVVEGTIASSATTAPVQDLDVCNAVNKMGDTEFELVRFGVHNDGRSFVAKSALNALRRTAVQVLRENILERYAANNWVKTENIRPRITIMSDISPAALTETIYKIETESQWELLRRYAPLADVIVSPLDFGGSEARALLKKLGKHSILDLPVMADGRDLIILRTLMEDAGPAYICANNPYGYRLGFKNIFPGYGMNVLNKRFVNGLFIQSPEASGVLSENAYVYTFGRLPLMTFKHCPRETLLGCKGCDREYSYTLRDDRGSFSIRHYSVGGCYAQLLNEKPILLEEELNRIGHKRRLYDFCGCDLRMMEAILRKETVPHVHFNFNKKLV